MSSVVKFMFYSRSNIYAGYYQGCGVKFPSHLLVSSKREKKLVWVPALFTLREMS